MSEIIVGKYHGRYLTAGNQQFVLLASPTGAEKGVGMVTPNLLNYQDSVVVFDLKLENFRYTSLYRQRHGQQVYLWAPFAEDGRTHRWNMLDAIDRNSVFRVGDILAIAQSFYPSDCHPKEKFWNDNARNLFLALVLYLMETPQLPCTLGEVLRQSSGAGQPLKQHLEKILSARRSGPTALGAECVDALNRFLSASSETVGNIISTFNAPLLIFANPIVDAATSTSDFSLANVRRKRMSVYLGIPPHRLSDAAVLANIFFSQLIDLNTKELPENDPSLAHECLLVLDELAAIGKIPILAKSNFYIRAYGLRLLTMLQSVSQLVARYGDADARTLLADHTIQVAYPPGDQTEAEEYSKMLGYLTQASVSSSASRNGGWSDPVSRSESRADHARPLMLPQELRIMPRHQQIVFARYCRPILCDKARYYEDHRFIDRLKSASPTLAALDNGLVNSMLRGLGFRPSHKVTPTEHEFKRAAFVLRELSVAIPAIRIAQRRQPTAFIVPAGAPTPAQAHGGGKPIATLPRFKDPEAPSIEEANAIVDAFFSQLPLFESAGIGTTAGQPPTGHTETLPLFPTKAKEARGKINNHKRGAANGPGADNTAARQAIDLSALDP